jgi:hypothetical protein
VDPVLEARAVRLHEAVARGTLESQLARALESGGVAGQSSVVMAARADAKEEAGRGGADAAARPNVEVEACRGDADSAAQPVAGEGAGGDSSERLTSRREEETPASEPPRAGVEGGTEEESAPGALVVEESLVPELARAGDEGAVVMVTVHTAPGNIEPVVELPLSNDEFWDSRDIDPAAAASAADRITEFVSSSEEVLSAGTSEGPRHGAIIQSGVPLEFLRNEQDEEAAWKAHYEVGSQIQDNLDCALQLHRSTDFQISKYRNFAVV